MKLAVFDIGGSAVKFGCWTNNQLTATSQFKTPDTYEGLVKNIKGVIDYYDDITGIAISSPGAVNISKRQIEGVSAVPYLHNFPIFDELERSLGLPVAIENDANCAGICEVKQGAGKNVQNMVFVVLGTGVGGAIFINGQLYKGSHLFGGEFGLMRNAQEKTFSMIGTGVKAALSYTKMTNKEITGKELFENAKTDLLAQEVLENLYETIANGLYNIQVSLDPSLIVIGGGISARKELIEAVRIRLYEKLKEETIEAIMPEIEACHYLNDANLIGAAHNFMLQAMKKEQTSLT